MPEIRMRNKNQITLPASIVKAANLKTGDRIDVDFIRGSIMMSVKPKSAPANSELMSFAGIGKGLWGNTREEVDASIRELRD